jgi:glycosyltransferase involved in cell wall biosynthesis
MAEAVFWLSAGFVAYVYFGYPALLAALGVVTRRPPKARPYEPSVSLLVAAYNEADVIEAKIRNALALDYPPDRLEIVIASDGSTDGTAEIAGRLAGGERVRLFAYPKNRGKINVLNDTVPQLRGEILVFSDASSMLAPDSLRRLAANFADPQVGAASGVYKVRQKEKADLGAQEDFYWKYETFLKTREAALGSVLGAHGSLYAIRRSLYPFPAPGTINDDYVIPVRILQQGYRVAYEPAAVAYEEAHEMGGFGRRVRIMAGNFQQMREIKPLLWPPRPLALFFFLSHKAGRALVPFAMVALAAANLFLLGRPLYRWLGVLHFGFYLVAGLGAIWKLEPRTLRLPYYFCMINAAAFLAIHRAISPRRQVAWKQ